MDSGVINIDGTTSINATGFDITLDTSTNDFTGAVTLTGGKVAIVDANNLLLTSISGTQANVSTDGGLTLTGAINAGSGTVSINVNQEFAVSAADNFTMQAGSSIVTTNDTSSAVTINGQSPLTPNSGLAANLINDGHFFTATVGGDKRTFSANVANGWVMVTVTFGSHQQALDGLRITHGDSGVVLADGLSTAVQTWDHVTFPALVTDGSLNLQFKDTTGPNRRVSLSGLEIRPLSLLSMGFPVPGALDADGTTVDRFTLYAGPANSLVTIDPSQGTLIGTDAEPAIVGFQVTTNASGQATFQLRRPASFGESVVELSSPTGQQIGCVVIDYCQTQIEMSHRVPDRNVTLVPFLGMRWANCD